MKESFLVCFFSDQQGVNGPLNHALFGTSTCPALSYSLFTFDGKACGRMESDMGKVFMVLGISFSVVVVQIATGLPRVIGHCICSSSCKVEMQRNDRSSGRCLLRSYDLTPRVVCRRRLSTVALCLLSRSLVEKQQLSSTFQFFSVNN